MESFRKKSDKPKLEHTQSLKIWPKDKTLATIGRFNSLPISLSKTTEPSGLFRESGQVEPLS